MRDADAERTPLARMARVAAVVVALDAATKMLAATHLADGGVAVAGPVSLALTYNDTFGRGLDLGAYTAAATFALTIAFVALAVAACAGLARVDGRAPRALGLVSGAALANAADFAHTGRGAVDFLAVATRDGAIVFNLADVAAYAGVLLLAGTALALRRAIAADRRIGTVAVATAVAPRAAAARLADRPRADRAVDPHVRTGEIVRPVPLFAEPSARRAPRTDADSPPVYPPPRAHALLLDDADVTVHVAPPLALERRVRDA